jgi:nicotinate-nucleotide pyrophosphorylase (carboxylating)
MAHGSKNKQKSIRLIIHEALKEDVGTGDITSVAAIPPESTSNASLIAKSPLVVAGLPFVEETFRQVDPSIVYEALVKDGELMLAGGVIARASGLTRGLLMAERVSLNILQHLSGIATLTARFVGEVAGTQARILDTRKTMPQMREMQKYAVRMGGGVNHRMGLYDGILIKDNHIVGAGGITRAVRKAQAARADDMPIEVECETLDQVREALDCGVDIIMLDNMTVDLMAEAVGIIAGRAKTEASGNVTLDNVREIALTGVDFISVGALTHSAPAADISMRFGA